jgi:hypothetical protein
MESKFYCVKHIWRYTMKKKSLFLVAILLLIFIGVVSAQVGPPGSGYWFGATHQNVGAGEATLAVKAYDSASASTYSTSETLTAGASLNIGPDSIPGLPAGFIGSIVTSSNEPLVALVNLTNRQSGSNGVAGGLAAAIYNGVDSSGAATELEFPLVKNNHFNKTTTFYLQNAGSAASTIDVTFNVGGTAYPYTTPSVAPGQMVAVDPGLAGVPSGNGNVGAMSLTSAQPIAGAMLEHESAAAIGTVLQGSGPGVSEDTIYCPTFKQNHFGRTSGIQVQNLHTAAQDITVTFKNASNTFNSTKNVAAGASVTFINDTNITSGTLFAATVAGADGPVAAVVNEATLPLPAGVQQTATTYNCAGASSATATASYPAYKENRFGRTTALQIQNVGGATATNVVLTFTDNNGNVRTSKSQTIASGASTAFTCVSANASLWNGTALAGNTLSGVTVTADQPILITANEASWSTTSPCTPNNGAGSFDKSTTEGFNLP